jgi:AcrR family transcriptional regulator
MLERMPSTAMSPRAYQLGKRREQIGEGRRRVLDAARSLLSEAGSYTAFTVDAVARRADVARATVYYQFDSKTGLLEALCDDLAEAGQLPGLAGAFTQPDPAEALRAFIAGFGRFWAADRLAMRRLRALAALDPEVGAVIAARDQRRRTGLEVLVGRLAESPQTAPLIDPERAVRVLFALTSFETFDALARPDQPLTDVTADVIGLAETAVAVAVAAAQQAGPVTGSGSGSPRAAAGE